MLISFGLTVRIIHFVLGLVWQKFHFRFLKFSTLFTFDKTDVQNWTSAHGEDEERWGGAGAQQLFLLQLNLKTSSTQRSRFGQDWVDSCEIRRGGWRWEGGEGRRGGCLVQRCFLMSLLFKPGSPHSHDAVRGHCELPVCGGGVGDSESLWSPLRRNRGWAAAVLDVRWRGVCVSRSNASVSLGLVLYKSSESEWSCGS